MGGQGDGATGRWGDGGTGGRGDGTTGRQCLPSFSASSYHPVVPPLCPSVSPSPSRPVAPPLCLSFAPSPRRLCLSIAVLCYIHRLTGATRRRAKGRDRK